ncbi:hypothetical protein [Portibacter lacus]|nr:hypothetical protein [Portibacter lacus]
MELSGYSGTPLAKKLGVKEGFQFLLRNEPSHYFDLFSDFPKTAEEVEIPEVGSLDFIHVFVKSDQELVEITSEAKEYLKKSGMLWVSWPKGSSKIVSSINRESVRAFVLSIGLVDIKVCSVDKDWSALKFVYRTKDR